jgi:hypothetical protein
MQMLVSIAGLIILIYVSAISSINTYLSSIQHLKYMIFSVDDFETISFSKRNFFGNSELIGFVNNSKVYIAPFTSTQIGSISRARNQGDNPQYTLHLVCIRQLKFTNPFLTYYLFTNFEVNEIKKEDN